MATHSSEMPAVHGSYARPCRVVMSRKVRTSIGRTNAHVPEVTSLEQERRSKAERGLRRADGTFSGEMPVNIGHDPTVLKLREDGQRPSTVLKQDGDKESQRVHARHLRRQMRHAYANLVGGRRPQSAGQVQEQLASDCGIFVPEEMAQDLASMVSAYHRPAEKPAEQALFAQVYGQLQLALEQKEKHMMKALRQRVDDAEAHDLEGGQQRLSLTEIRNTMSEFGIAEETMLNAVMQALAQEGNADGNLTFAELRSAVAGIKDPTSPTSKAGWRDKLSKSFEQVMGSSGTQSLGLSREQQMVYRTFLDRLMPALENQVDFMVSGSANMVRRRKTGTGKRPAPQKCKSAEPGLFGGPAFRMPTIAESGSAPVMRLADLKSKENAIGHDKRDSVNALMKGLPPPQKKVHQAKHISRPGTQHSAASSCWSEFRERKSPYRKVQQSMADLLPADRKMFSVEDQWKTVAQLEVSDPGSGLAGEKERVKSLEDRFFQKMANFQRARDNVDGRAHGDLDKKDKRYENRLSNIAEIRGSIQAKVEEDRNVNVGLGNVMIPSGDLDNQPKFRAAQIYEGPRMDAKREQDRERQRVLMERRALDEVKEEERKRLQIQRESERMQIIADKQAKDREKEEIRSNFVKERESKKLVKDELRKEADGWSVDHALKGLKADVSADCEMIPEGFTQESIKEERRINGIMRQDARYEGAVERIRKHSDKKRSRFTKMLWGENPTLDLPGAVLEYVSPPKRREGTGPVEMEEANAHMDQRQKGRETAGRACGEAAAHHNSHPPRVRTGARDSRHEGLFGGGGRGSNRAATPFGGEALAFPAKHFSSTYRP